jgi:hypothetical protein
LLELTDVNDMMPLTDPHRKNLLQDFKAFYMRPDVASLEWADRLYTQDIEFRDPLHTINGILAFKSYLRGVYTGPTNIRFEYVDELCGEHWASITWIARYRHDALDGGRTLQLRGTTQIRFTDRIYYQEDFFDVGAMVYQHLPLLGPVVRYINRRISR